MVHTQKPHLLAERLRVFRPIHQTSSAKTASIARWIKAHAAGASDE